jgi:type IV pilus assembly protein PilY1
MGASLHSEPVVVNYSSLEGDLVLSSGSDGILKAIDADTGLELWGFIPKDLLQNIKKIALNSSSTTPEYGLDGTLTIFTVNDKKYVVIGMRRGGRSYYAVDITDRTSPKFAWKINASGDFSQLGQTWSKPLFVKMYLSNSDQDVLVFGGGYDSDQDTALSRTTDDQGNVIYIVTPETGALIKKISNSGADINIPDMTNSIASNLLPVDINANGIIDRLYASDVGGRIIRVDIPDSKFTDTTLSGGIIADINSGGTGGFKRFFNTPEVGYFSNSGLQYISILIGSGNRPNPLSSTETDRFYMIRDNAVWKAPLDDINHNNKWDAGETFDYHTVQAYKREVTVNALGSLENIDNNGELYNATENLIQDGSQQQQVIEERLLAGEGSIEGTKGWFIDLSTAEKSVTRAVLYDNIVLFTTYSGSVSANLDLCEANKVVGTSRLYAVDMSNGSAIKHLSSNTNSPLNKQDRVMELKIEGLPPAASLTYGTDKTIRAIVGVEKVMELDDTFHAISWETVNE